METSGSTHCCKQGQKMSWVEEPQAQHSTPPCPPFCSLDLLRPSNGDGGDGAAALPDSTSSTSLQGCLSAGEGTALQGRLAPGISAPQRGRNYSCLSPSSQKHTAVP